MWVLRGGGVLGAGTACTFLALASPARAGGPLGGNGEPITTSQYALDAHEGPVYSGARVVGLGGAYVAIAEDVDGDLQNPAAPAVRPFYSTDHFDYALGLSLAFPADLENMDYFNSGSTTAIDGSQEGFVFATPALNLQWGSLGVGATLAVQNYAVKDVAFNTEGGEASLDIVVNTLQLQAANAFMQGQLILGLGTRILTQVLEAKTMNLTQRVFATTGSGVELGALYRPNDRPFRIGLALRDGIETTPEYSDALLPDENGDITIPRGDEVVYLPHQVSTPWDINLGVALQFGRPFNPTWKSSAERAERATLYYRQRELDREDERRRRSSEASSEAERHAIDATANAEQEADDHLLELAIDNARRLMRYENAKMDQFYVLFSSSLLVSGQVKEAVGVDSLLSQQINRSGQKVVYSPRFGAELEAWPGLVKVRMGTYLEPSRFQTSLPRWHATTGFDLRLIRWNVFGLWPDDYLWRLSASADASERYLVWGLSIGGWYPRGAPHPLFDDGS